MQSRGVPGGRAARRGGANPNPNPNPNHPNPDPYPSPEPRARARALTQVLTLDHDGAESAFASLRPKLPEKERGQAADEWLFNVFATAAIRAAADGGVWKA